MSDIITPLKGTRLECVLGLQDEVTVRECIASDPWLRLIMSQRDMAQTARERHRRLGRDCKNFHFFFPFFFFSFFFELFSFVVFISFFGRFHATQDEKEDVHKANKSDMLDGIFRHETEVGTRSRTRVGQGFFYRDSQRARGFAGGVTGGVSGSSTVGHPVNFVGTGAAADGRARCD